MDKPFFVFVVFLMLSKFCVSSYVSWVYLCNNDRLDADLIGVWVIMNLSLFEW